MIVHYTYMTGDELRKIHKLSGINQDALAKMLGLETRSALLNQFNRGAKPIDDDVEKAVKKLPELSQHRLLIVSQQNLKRPFKKDRTLSRDHIKSHLNRVSTWSMRQERQRNTNFLTKFKP